MNIKVNKKALANAVAIVLKAVPNKTTMNILENIMISAIGKEICLTANDLELGISSGVDGEIIEQGKICLDAKLFAEIVRKLPDGDINIKIDEKNTALIKCGKSKFTLAAKNADEFPLPQYVDAASEITISELSLRDAIKQTIFCVNMEDQNKKLMSALNFKIVGSVLSVTALDGHRIGIRNIKLAEEYSETEVNMPGKTMTELSKILTGGIDDKVNIKLGNSSVAFKFGNTVVTSRLVEGNYFKVDQMIAGDTPIHISINRKNLVSTVDRALTLVGAEKKPIILTKTENSLSLSVKSVRGEMTEDIELEDSSVDNIVIGINPKFIMDVLQAVETEVMHIYMCTPRAPLYIKDSSGDYLYLILPVTINK